MSHSLFLHLVVILLVTGHSTYADVGEDLERARNPPEGDTFLMPAKEELQKLHRIIMDVSAKCSIKFESTCPQLPVQRKHCLDLANANHDYLRKIKTFAKCYRKVNCFIGKKSYKKCFFRSVLHKLNKL